MAGQSIGIRNIPLSIDQHAYFLIFCSVYDFSAEYSVPHKDILKLIEYHKGRIHPGKFLTYRTDFLETKITWNKLNPVQLYLNVRGKVDTYPLHNMYEIILRVVYHRKLMPEFVMVIAPFPSPRLAPTDPTPLRILFGATPITSQTNHETRHIIASCGRLPALVLCYYYQTYLLYNNQPIIFMTHQYQKKNNFSLFVYFNLYV